jgi:hypothetical protein
MPAVIALAHLSGLLNRGEMVADTREFLHGLEDLQSRMLSVTSTFVDHEWWEDRLVTKLRRASCWRLAVISMEVNPFCREDRYRSILPIGEEQPSCHK